MGKKRPEELTSREKEVLQFVWSGYQNREIADRLKVSVKTVEAHRANMLRKYRVSNVAQLLKATLQKGVLSI